MVERGLKVGATFVDGGNTYKVMQVLADGNYISKMVDSSEAIKAEKAEPTVKKPVKKGK
jgi:hypothetical protein